MKLLMCDVQHRRICHSAPAMCRPRYQRGNSEEGKRCKKSEEQNTREVANKLPTLTIIPVPTPAIPAKAGISCR